MSYLTSPDAEYITENANHESDQGHHRGKSCSDVEIALLKIVRP